MQKTIRQLLAACGLALATATLCVPAAAAATEKPVTAKKAKAKATAKAKAKKAKAKAKPAAKSANKAAGKLPAAADVFVDEPEPDITYATTTEYQCELNNKVTIYNTDAEDGHIALRWKERLHRLDRVGTTTGALRFENSHYGLVWIGIPSKGMLLDSKLGRQLANECKNDEQLKATAGTAESDQQESFAL